MTAVPYGPASRKAANTIRSLTPAKRASSKVVNQRQASAAAQRRC